MRTPKNHLLLIVPFTNTILFRIDSYRKPEVFAVVRNMVRPRTESPQCPHQALVLQQWRTPRSVFSSYLDLFLLLALAGFLNALLQVSAHMEEVFYGCFEGRLKLDPELGRVRSDFLKVRQQQSQRLMAIYNQAPTI